MVVWSLALAQADVVAAACGGSMHDALVPDSLTPGLEGRTAAVQRMAPLRKCSPSTRNKLISEEESEIGFIKSRYRSGKMPCQTLPDRADGVA